MQGFCVEISLAYANSKSETLSLSLIQEKDIYNYILGRERNY